MSVETILAIVDNILLFLKLGVAAAQKLLNTRIPRVEDQGKKGKKTECGRMVERVRKKKGGRKEDERNDDGKK